LQASRSLLQSPETKPAPEAKTDCSDLSILEKAKCLASQAADAVSGAASSAGTAIVDTYNNVVGNEKPANGTAAAAVAANGTAPASSASAASGFAAAAVATVFALAY
jgi:hypothetical protein